MKSALLMLFVAGFIFWVAVSIRQVDAYQPPESIRVISKTHVVDFPESVTLKLEAESDLPVRSIKVFYTLGNDEVRIYGYPEFVPSKTVKAEFVIKTSGANYLPQGVVINYNYLIEDSQGRFKETESSKLEYLDPRFGWDRVSVGELVILYHDRPSNLVEQALLDVYRRTEDVKKMFMMENVKPQKAVVMNSVREATKNFPYISERATRDHLYSGFAYGDYDLFLLVGLSRSGMIHEFTHLLLDETIDSPLARVPGWLNEGLAMYFEFEADNRRSILVRALKNNELLALNNMDSVPGIPKDVHLFYNQSASLVDYLITAYGENQISEMIQSIGNGKDVEQAFQEIYGFSLEQLELNWVDQIQEHQEAVAQNPVQNTESLVSLGLYAIASLAFVTVVYLIVVIKRNIQNRQE